MAIPLSLNQNQDKQYLYSLTGIRGVAAFMVVLSHMHSFNFAEWVMYPYAGDFSVMLFFALSGFLMGYLYSRKDFDLDAVIRYGITRFSRIAPAYLVAVLLCFVVYQFLDPNFPVAVSTDNLLRHLLFSGSADILWSIPPEVQFYGLFIAIWFCLAALLKEKSIVPIFLMTFVAIVFISYRDSLPGIFVGSKLAYFYLGALFGYMRPSLDKFSIPDKHISLLQASIAVVALVILFIPAEAKFSPNEYWNNNVHAIAAAFAILVFSFPSTFCRVTMSNRLIQNLGLWSFSLYLIHMPVLYVTELLLGHEARWIGALGIVLSVVASYGFYQLVEKPGIIVLKGAMLSGYGFVRNQIQWLPVPKGASEVK